MSDKTAMWRSRVAAWRASGQTATAFATGQDFSVSALRWWSSRFAREARAPVPTPTIRLARVERSVDAEVIVPPPGRIVIELRDLRARLVLDGHVDREVLSTVLATLREGAR